MRSLLLSIGSLIVSLERPDRRQLLLFFCILGLCLEEGRTADELMGLLSGADAVHVDEALVDPLFALDHARNEVPHIGLDVRQLFVAASSIFVVRCANHQLAELVDKEALPTLEKSHQARGPQPLPVNELLEVQLLCHRRLCHRQHAFVVAAAAEMSLPVA